LIKTDYEIDTTIDENDEFLTMNAFMEPIAMDERDQSQLDIFVIIFFF
jgi:hypothetical protein